MTQLVDLEPPPAPPARAGRGGGGGGEWVELTRARDDIDAHLLAGRLAEAGIATRSVKDRGAPGAWLYGGSNPWAPVVLLVRLLQLEDARLVLATISFEAPAMAGPGSELDRPSGFAWWMVAVTLGTVLTAVALAQVAAILAAE